MLAMIESSVRAAARWLSPSEWAIRLLGLSTCRGTAVHQGLVMIQIDGLSRTNLHRAMQQHHMPFVRRLLRGQGYRLHSMYTGLPASTPSVQAELFYGKRMAVPAFNFRDRETGEVFRMYDPPDAAAVEQRLAAGGPALLEGGSAWSNIFSGGAAESHFCSSTLGWGKWLRAMTNPLVLLALIVTHAHIVVRVAALIALELLLATLGFLRGTVSGKGWLEELLFIPTRAGICILLRELVVLGAQIDIARGLPVIHLNFIGYDEQAHRRGPSSDFAHWTLRGIDSAIARIWHAAQRSGRRHYDVWVYSDHGQEDTVPYPSLYFTTVQEAVEELFGKPASSGHAGHGRLGEQTRRINLLGGRWASRVAERDHAADPAATELVVTGMGALGHIYGPEPSSVEERDQWGRKLVASARIPFVLAADGPQQARVWTKDGVFQLPQDAERLLGAEHPYLHDVAHDLVALAHHPDAGTFVISGWMRSGQMVSFPMEYGSHTGPGAEETNAFALLPADAQLTPGAPQYLRPLDLRRAALNLLGRGEPAPAEPPAAHAARRKPATLRIVTYNVHRCIGMDGKLSPERIARVIARQRPDAVALQEVDVGRRRTGGLDQTELIAGKLGMTGQFHPAMRFSDGAYGIAIMSRYPMRLVKADVLPRLRAHPPYEPRAALWTVLDVGGTAVHLLNAHLSLWGREQLLQAQALLGPEWLGAPECRGPVVLCGDFNAPPGSEVHRRLGRRLLDTQLMPAAGRPMLTWIGRFPVSRIDHVLISGALDVTRIEVPRTELDLVASDHLPLVVDLQV